MDLIRILDHVNNASTYDDGQVIFDLIAPKIQQGEAVSLSFDGILAVPSAFINAAIVQLLEIVPIASVRSKLKILQSTKAINELIKRRFEFVEEKGNVS